jgi:DNA (cytosine-5)-methyltransferase 1
VGCGDHSTNDCKKKLNVLDLFSGIGGFSLGLESAGPFRTIAFCEREPFCQAVLRKHWPDVPIFDDVRTIPTDGLGRVDLIAGGWPCQPWSQAGQQRGAEDDRDLWPEVARLVGELRPRWLVGENVRGFVNQPMGLERSLSDLESLGYQAVAFIIPACAVDAPHRRDRVWIIAHANIEGEPDGTVNARARRRKLVGDTKGERHKRRSDVEREGAASQQVKQSSVWREPSGSSEIVADADSERSQRVGANSNAKRREKSTQRPAGLFDGTAAAQRWPIEPDVGRVAHGVPRRVDRLKALGNAVVPSVVAQIGRAILEAENC